MDKNILFYGNCQTDALMHTVNYKNKKCIPCWLTNISEEDFLNEIVKADIIVTQPINDNYRDKKYLSTKFIIDNSRDDTIIIIFPSIQLNFYYFDLTYKIYNGEVLHNPSDYHYNEFIQCIKNNESVVTFKSNVLENKNFKTKDELLNYFNISINELKKREILMDEYKNNINNVYTIKITQFIEENYLDKLLFWTVNHPSKYIFQFIALEILKILNINENIINYDNDILSHNERCLLYKCLENVVRFNINDFTPQMIRYKENNVDNILNHYVNAYSSLDIKLL